MTRKPFPRSLRLMGILRGFARMSPPVQKSPYSRLKIPHP